MDGHHHLHHLHHLHHQQQHHQPQPQPLQLQKTMAVAAAAAVEASPAASVGDRFPQWSAQETKELLGIRAELDQTFMETKRNKLLWEVISNKMKDKGFLRSPEQCKCKWKNLVTRYKGCETMDPETARQQFPFYDDMQAIFTSRMQMMLWTEAEGGGGGTSATKKKASGQLSSDEEEEYINEEIASEELLGDISNPKTLNPRKNIPKKRKGIGGSSVYSKIGSTSSSSSSSGVREVLEEFMRQQLRIEREWREAWEAREKERAEREAEWRKRMEELEKERASVERMWREKEEQRRAREEARAEKRDALINVLLTKLTREGSL